MVDMPRYLRRFDLLTNKPTNMVYGYSEEAALIPGMQVIDEATYFKCLADLKLEKIAAANKRREALSVNSDVPLPPLPVAPAPAPVATAPVAPPAAPEPDTETASPVPAEAAAPVPEAESDGLDAKTKVELQNLIDAEGLRVSKIGNKADLVANIRKARLANQSETVTASAPKIEG